MQYSNQKGSDEPQKPLITYDGRTCTVEIPFTANGLECSAKVKFTLPENTSISIVPFIRGCGMEAELTHHSVGFTKTEEPIKTEPESRIRKNEKLQVHKEKDTEIKKTSDTAMPHKTPISDFISEMKSEMSSRLCLRLGYCDGYIEDLNEKVFFGLRGAGSKTYLEFLKLREQYYAKKQNKVLSLTSSKPAQK